MSIVFQNMSRTSQNSDQDGSLPSLVDQSPNVDISNAEFHRAILLLALAITVQFNLRRDSPICLKSKEGRKETKKA